MNSLMQQIRQIVWSVVSHANARPVKVDLNEEMKKTLEELENVIEDEIGRRLRIEVATARANFDEMGIRIELLGSVLRGVTGRAQADSGPVADYVWDIVERTMMHLKNGTGLIESTKVQAAPVQTPELNAIRERPNISTQAELDTWNEDQQRAAAKFNQAKAPPTQFDANIHKGPWTDADAPKALPAAPPTQYAARDGNEHDDGPF